MGEVWLNSSTAQDGQACACYSAPKIADSFFVQLLNTKLCRSTLMVVLRRCLFLWAKCKLRSHHSAGALFRLAHVHIACKVLLMHLQASATEATHVGTAKTSK